jgi:hypothetical protein
MHAHPQHWHGAYSWQCRQLQLVLNNATGHDVLLAVQQPEHAWVASQAAAWHSKDAGRCQGHAVPHHATLHQPHNSHQCTLIPPPALPAQPTPTHPTPTCLPAFPQDLSWLAVAAILAVKATGYIIFRGANGQKDSFRRDPSHPSVAHLRTLKTERGTRLIISGWWGVARHINYFGDWIMG